MFGEADDHSDDDGDWLPSGYRSPIRGRVSEPLRPLELPLWGSRLIEASAGTGKTWTIAALYLRLVLGHGGPGQAFARPLAPAEVLVLTFTRAATRELSAIVDERDTNLSVREHAVFALSQRPAEESVPALIRPPGG